MKKLLVGFSIFILFLGQTFALESDPMRAEGSIVINEGFVKSTGILSDNQGMIFLEFLKDSYAARLVEKEEPEISTQRISPGDISVRMLEKRISTAFEGEILPPEIIEMPARPPRSRMKEVIAFELLTDSGEDVVFIDRFTQKKAKTRLKEELTNPDEFFQRSGIRLLTRINEEDKILLPTLWEFRGEEYAKKICQRERNLIKRQKCEREKVWKKLGGKVEESDEEGINIFSAVFTKNGIYAIIDENPSPDFVPPFPIDEIDLVEESPFPSVEEEVEFPEGDSEIPPFIEEDDTSPLGVPGDENPFSGLPQQAGNLAPGEIIIPSIPESGDGEAGTPQVVDLPVSGEIPTGTPGEVIPLSPFQPIDTIPAVEGGQPQALPPLEPLETEDTPLSSAPPAEDFFDSPEEDIALEELEITDDAKLPQSGSFKFPLVMILAFLVIGVSGVLAFRKKTPPQK